MAHFVPECANSCLISIKKCCDVGCRVVYDAPSCYVYSNNKIILQDQGMRRQNYGHYLFKLICNTHYIKWQQNFQISNGQTIQNWQHWLDYTKIEKLERFWTYLQHHAHVNAARLNRFYCQFLVSLLASSWIHFTDVQDLQPLLSDNTSQYQQQQSKDISSNYHKTCYLQQNQSHKENNCKNTSWAAIADTKNETIYINLARKIHVVPMKATNTFVAYDYNSNAIIVQPLSTASNPSATIFKRSTLNHNLVYWTMILKHLAFGLKSWHIAFSVTYDVTVYLF